MSQENIKLEEAIARFKELRGRHGHLSRQDRSEYAVRCFHTAQVEMYQLAQVICMLLTPAIQIELDEVRREIMEQIDLKIKVPTGARVTTKRIPKSSLLWSEFQITPEISVDPTITGNMVLRPLLKRLKGLLRAQCSTVNARVYR